MARRKTRRAGSSMKKSRARKYRKRRTARTRRRPVRRRRLRTRYRQRGGVEVEKARARFHEVFPDNRPIAAIPEKEKVKVCKAYLEAMSGEDLTQYQEERAKQQIREEGAVEYARQKKRKRGPIG